MDTIIGYSIQTEFLAFLNDLRESQYVSIYKIVCNILLINKENRVFILISTAANREVPYLIKMALNLKQCL